MADNTNNEEMNENQIPLEKPSKQKKPKTPKQIEQFEKMKLKRAEILKENKTKKEIESAKLLLNNGYVKKEEIQVPLTPSISNNKDETDIESEEEEPTIIIRKKKKAPKKKPKTIIIEETDSEDDSVTSEEPIKIKARDFVSQRNKKSIIKIHKNNKSEPFSAFF